MVASKIPYDPAQVPLHHEVFSDFFHLPTHRVFELELSIPGWTPVSPKAHLNIPNPTDQNSLRSFEGSLCVQ